MAGFCVATGYTPKEFWEMEKEEVDAISVALRRKNV